MVHFFTRATACFQTQNGWAGRIIMHGHCCFLLLVAAVATVAVVACVLLFVLGNVV